MLLKNRYCDQQKLIIFICEVGDDQLLLRWILLTMYVILTIFDRVMKGSNLAHSVYKHSSMSPIFMEPIQLPSKLNQFILK